MNAVQKGTKPAAPMQAAMKAVRVVEGRSDFVCESVAVPALRTGSVRVRVEAAFLPPYFAALPGGGWSTPPRPFTPGQCAIGIVEEVAAPGSALAVGQRVYCDLYVEGAGRQARSRYGFIGCFGVGAETGPLLAEWPDGSFADKVVLPGHCLVPVPDGIDASAAVLCRLGWFATALAGFERGGFKPGMRVAINGATGLLGTSAALVALAIGASEVQLFGRREGIVREIASVDPRLRIGTGGSSEFDFLLDCTSGASADGLASLLQRLDRYGSAIIVGAPQTPLALDASLLMRKTIRLQGSFWFPAGTAERCLSLIEAGALDLSPLRAETFPLDRIGEAMERSSAASAGFAHVALVPATERTGRG